jgi:hypothetical protein
MNKICGLINYYFASYANNEGSIVQCFTAGIKNVGGDGFQNGMSGTK